MSTLQVGIIGVSSEQSWGREAHVPSVQAVDGLTLAAVATRDQRSADRIASALDVDRACGDPFALIADPDIDIVAVATPVPTHHDLIIAALEAGKNVVTEWPVGTSTRETEEIAAVARRTGCRTAVNLQSRLNPVTIKASEIISSGSLGRVLTATVLSTTAGFGRTIPSAARYLEDPSAGMNLTTIQTAHTIDFALLLAGGLTSLSALTTIQYPELEIQGRDETLQRTVADHVLAQGRLEGGGALSMQVVGGRPPGDTPFRMDVVGERLTLTLVGGAIRGFQAGVLELLVDGERIPVTHRDYAVSESATNVAHVYAAFRDDITSGTCTAPDFSHAVQLSHLIDDLLTAADQQRTITPTGAWPH